MGQVLPDPRQLPQFLIPPCRLVSLLASLLRRLLHRLRLAFHLAGPIWRRPILSPSISLLRLPSFSASPLMPLPSPPLMFPPIRRRCGYLLAGLPWCPFPHQIGIQQRWLPFVLVGLLEHRRLTPLLPYPPAFPYHRSQHPLHRHPIGIDLPLYPWSMSQSPRVFLFRLFPQPVSQSGL